MAVALEYNELALAWDPASRGERRFLLIAFICLIVFLAIGWRLSSIKVPVEERKEQIVPKRIAEFILEREKEQPKVEPKPEPKPLPKPEPVEKVKPKVTKKREVKSEIPLNDKQKKARDKAQESGLLALSSELADLVDTSKIDSMISKKVTSSGGANIKAQLDSTVLSINATKGSGGINASKYGDARVSSTTISAQELVKINQRLIAEQSSGASSQETERVENSGNFRSEEEVSLVFDQNKGKLYSIYNRERRKSPGLKGKIVLEITINPNGKVSFIRIISSELNNPKLEQSLLARIKQFKFSSDKEEPITITYPIEFLPS
ncbi:AgmX/PglI C-terminal domain-containing protein [Aliikangiella sp. G2MR2-5]|uniref:AgmX/PglI C-terminal domain-containing protein n=1 Tax=Aliikangiella sp. G2MR2-5 TaxID=2788943 RepID=UPI0018AA3994|nr:AgmX/PglI C-terminal domain-containing protein [Aliikangiella sp. G2MR2-5]